MARDHILTLVSRALGAHGRAALLVKGVAVANLYPSPWQRPMVDLDLLVREADLAAAVRALEQAGFTSQAAPERVRTSALLEVPMTPPAPLDGQPVELHLSLDKVVLRDIDVAGMFARAKPSAEWPALRVPSVEDQLLLVVLHLAADEYRHQTGFVDLEVLLSAGADLDLVAERARRSRSTIAHWVALATLESLSPGTVPAHVLAALRPSEARRRALAARFRAGQWPVARTERALGLPWALGQLLLRDDVVAFGRGLVGYWGKRLRER